MKKILFLALAMLALPFLQKLHAQATFTADLELIFRDTTRHFILEPYDSLDVGFAVVNHGPDDIDTSNYVLFSMTGIPSAYFLVVQSDDGHLMPIPEGDTVPSWGIRFTNMEPDTADITVDYCFFLRTTEDSDNFIDDSNQSNDTICFTVTYKKDQQTGIAHIGKQSVPLKISPNPASDIINIPVSEFGNKETRLTIYSTDGRIVYKQQWNNMDNVQVDVRTWPKGMYIMDIRSDGLKKNGRFTVQ